VFASSLEPRTEAFLRNDFPGAHRPICERFGASVSKRAITFSDPASAFAERTLSLIWTAAGR